jgi:type I restriction enzyme S subunit
MDTKTFLENFGHVVDAPNGVLRIRELVLELSIQGKLTSQNTNEESGHIVFEKNQKKKEKLIDHGEIKRQKNLTEIDFEEIPFNIPDTWKWCRLGEITNYGASDKAEPTDIHDDTWVLELEDVEKITSKLLQKIFYKDRQSKSTKSKFQKNDVIYGKLRPYLDKVIVADEDGVCTTEMIPVRSYYGITPEYLRWVMKSPYFISYADSSTHGMNLPRLGTDRGREALFPLPPHEEQNRIVAKVNQFMDLCDQLETQQKQKAQTRVALNNAALDKLLTAQKPDEFNHHWQRIVNNFQYLYDNLENLNNFRDAILELAIRGKLVEQDPNDKPASEVIRKTLAEKKKQIESKVAKDSGKMHQKAPKKPHFEIPSSWEWVRFRDVIWCFRGHNPPKSDFIYKPKKGYVRFVQITDFKTNDRAVYVPNTNKLKMVYKNEIIMAAYRHIGKLSRNMEGAFNVALCKVLEFPPMNRDYVEMLIGTDVVKGELLRASERGHIPSMHSDHLLSLLVPIPPVEEQKRIVAKVVRFMILCDQLEANIREKNRIASQYSEAIVNELAVA